MSNRVPDGTQWFRWHVYDDNVGEDWTEWHSVAGECPGCCHGGPHDGVHQHGTMDYDEDQILTATHRWLDPSDFDDEQVESSPSPQRPEPTEKD